MDEAKNSDPTAYSSFNDFFCRPLRKDARPLEGDAHNIVSPADGSVSQLGNIDYGRIFQAKGRDYSVAELLGGNKTHTLFERGKFATIYLSPKDYHRLHMPMDGKLVSATHVPGKLFSVNPATCDHVPRLFARNERLVCVFETSCGKVALVLVGAMVVASIETTWAGLVIPPEKKITTTTYQNPKQIDLAKGEEFARFRLGSTIIMLLQENTIEWNKNLGAESTIRMGQQMARIIS